jgi:DNA-binding CsgD family transcriptional regulator
LTRIAIVGDTLFRARRLANLLADSEWLDIVDVRATNGSLLDVRVDVVVATGLGPGEASRYRVPVVCVGDRAPAFGRNTRASLPASASASEIGAAVQAAANDLTVLTQEQMVRWAPPSNQSRGEEEALIEELTPRELQVLRMIADGDGNKEIALTLGISEHTVKFHVAQILAKLNAGSRTEAVSLGIRLGLIAV